jgi:hypothetical protein
MRAAAAEQGPPHAALDRTHLLTYIARVSSAKLTTFHRERSEND